MQLRGCVYAKKFYPVIVVQGGLNAMGPSDGRGWMLQAGQMVADRGPGPRSASQVASAIVPSPNRLACPCMRGS